MKFRILLLILITPLAHGLLIPGKFSPKINLKSLRLMKINLESELQLLMPPSVFSNKSSSVGEGDVASKNEVDEELLILPRNLLTSDIYHKLGLFDFANDCALVNLTLKNNINQEIFIPKNSKSLFIMNSKESLKFPVSSSSNNKGSIKKSKEFSEFISSSFPFDIPEFIYLIDYFMVIPKTYIDDQNSTDRFNKNSIYSRSVLNALWRNYHFLENVSANIDP